ncbi:MAG: YfcC family protein [Candidatus Aminicenantes bacterium]
MKFKVPHTYVLLMGLILVAAVSTWLIPAGRYARADQDGRELINPESFHAVKSNPANVPDILLAFPKGLIEVSDIVFYIFIIGGAFGVLNRTGTIQAGINFIVRRVGKKRALIVPVLTLVFAVGGGSIGIAEETLIFLPPLLMLARSLGYDSLVAGGIALVGANAGFASAFMNPFTVGVAQGIVGLPLFSGIEFRSVVWLIITTVTIIFMSRYASRVRSKPSLSSMYELDLKRQPVEDHQVKDRFTKGHVAVLMVSIMALAALAVGAIYWKWGILQLSALFFGLSIIAGPLGGLTLDETAQSFIKGAADITYAALVVGLARGTLVILRDAYVIDTITHAMAAAVQQLPSSFSVMGIYIMQNGLNFIIPSGSGHAAVAMPILAPLGDLLGISRQTNVLAYQLGNGFTNVFTPTQGYFMAALGILKIPWSTWVRWLFPLLFIWVIIGAGAVLVAHAIQWGPF